MFHRIDHSFTMALAPARAQELFNEDVASELAAQDEFKIVREAPGLIVLNDDVWHSPGEPGQPMTAAEPFDEGFQIESVSEREPMIDIKPGEGIRVEFHAHGEGTDVRIRGHADASVREALERLGTPGHWPEGRIVAT